MSVRSSESSVFDLISNMGVCAAILNSGRGSSLEIQRLHEHARLRNLNLAFGAAYCLEHYCGANFDLTLKVRG